MIKRNSGDRFGTVPQNKEIKRSHFSDVKYSVLSTGNAGYLHAIGYPIEVLPGDTFANASAGLVRLQTPRVPVMDRAYLDTFWFFVPWTQIWKHTKQFFGESEVAGYEKQNEYTIPFINYNMEARNSENKGYQGSYIDEMGLPTRSRAAFNNSQQVNALPFRAIRHIWNNYFRDQNLMDALLVNDGDRETDKTLFDLLPVCKLHDYFTSALPYAQKTDPITLNLSNTTALPIYAGASLSDNDVYKYITKGTEEAGGTDLDAGAIWTTLPDSPTGLYYNMALRRENDTDTYASYSMVRRSTEVSEDVTDPGWPLIPRNLWADVSVGLGAINIIDLRMAFAMQRFYENLALHGSRYYEYIRGSFGITVPELNIDIPEYLGGATAKIGMKQVTDVSSEGLGNNGAYSITTISNRDFNKTFTQHGYLIGLYCIRNRNSYQQGTMRLWKHKELFDIYQPELANVGEQPIYNYEIATLGTYDNNADNEIFGYQERYAEYRYFPNIVTGEFRTNAIGSMDEYHYADYYESLPVLSEDWIKSSPKNIDRTLNVSSEAADQFYCSWEICMNMRRKMPLYGGHSMQGWM